MHLGSNDAFWGESAESTIADLEAIIGVLRAANPEAVQLSLERFRSLLETAARR